ncbi:MAG: LysM peptidoglycan-binding domain-containing protein [Acidobacteriota bacterium]
MNPRFFRLLPGLARLVLAGAVVAASSAGMATASDRPPHPLHKVGDHWTAWEPPTPAADAQIYIIQKGDTLWDLAKKFNGNPYLWPQLWEKNQYIKDAHWIYPGDPLVSGVQVAPAQQVGEGPGAATTEGSGAQGAGAGEQPAAEPSPSEGPAGVLTAAAAAGPPVQLGATSDIDCSGYIGDPVETFGYHLTGSEYQVQSPQLSGTASRGNVQGIYGAADSVKFGLDTGDVVYVDGGQAGGLTAGTVLVAVEPGALVKHPVTGAIAGRMYHYLGRVRVLSVQDKTAIGEIVHSCEPINVGAALKLYEEEPVPLGRRTLPRPVSDPAPAAALANAPVILASSRDEITIGQDHVVFIDRGADDQVSPGDSFTIYRMNREGFPPVPIGELAVLAVRPHSAVARVTQSRAPVYVGDRLQLK